METTGSELAEGAGMAYQPSTARTPLGAVCLIYARDVDAVLLQRRIGSHGADTWAPPGGWVDPGEDPAEAAKREVWEEVGLEVEGPLEWLGYTTDIHVEGIRGVTMWFRAANWSGRARSTNPARVAEVMWWPTGKLLQGQGPGPLFLPVRNALQKGLLG